MLFHQRKRGGGHFQTLKFDPYVMMYFIYHDLKVKTDQRGGRGSIYNVRI